MIDCAATINAFRKIYRETGSPKRAAGEKKYLKSNLQFYGVPLPQIKGAVKDFCASHPAMSRGELLSLVDALWSTDHHELRSTGIGLLDRKLDLLKVSDMKVVERLVRKSQTWAYVDWLAVRVAGRLVLEFPTAKRVLSRWSRDPYMWVRRSSMLALLPSLKLSGRDFPLFAKFASAMINEDDFFIRKAIGWVLREVGKKRPDEAYQFLIDHRADVSGLTLREGSKYLAASKKKTLMERYGWRRGATRKNRI